MIRDGCDGNLWWKIELGCLTYANSLCNRWSLPYFHHKIVHTWKFDLVLFRPYFGRGNGPVLRICVSICVYYSVLYYIGLVSIIDIDSFKVLLLMFIWKTSHQRLYECYHFSDIFKIMTIQKLSRQIASFQFLMETFQSILKCN